jgi:hypothetical protein
MRAPGDRIILLMGTQAPLQDGVGPAGVAV